METDPITKWVNQATYTGVKKKVIFLTNILHAPMNRHAGYNWV